MDGVRIVTSAFEEASRKLEQTVKTNTQYFGETMAKAFETTAKRDATWINRKNVARRGLYGTAKMRDGHVVVEMGGKAQNYKKKSQYDDYMEILEWGHESLGRNFPNLAVVYPTYELIRADYTRQYGRAVFSGVSFRMVRSKAAARTRARKSRARAREIRPR